MEAKSLLVECVEDCGNAPKKLLIKEISIDYWGDRGQKFLDQLADEAVRVVVGGPRHVGIEAIRAQMANDRAGQPTELRIHHIITHGNTAAANATVIMQDGSRMEYCDVYRFSGFGKKAKIKEITSYRIYIQ